MTGANTAKGWNAITVKKMIGGFLQPMLKNRTAYNFFAKCLLSDQEKTKVFVQDVLS
jgi:hypothetical protein